MFRKQLPPKVDPVAQVKAEFRTLAATHGLHTPEYMRQITLLDVKDEIARCTRLLPIWRRGMHVGEGGELAWAMEAAMNIYTELSAGSITWVEAARRCVDQVSVHTMAFESALWREEIKQEYATRATKIQTTIQEWLRKKWWLENIDGTFELSALGWEHIDEINEAILALGGKYIFVRKEAFEF